MPVQPQLFPDSPPAAPPPGPASVAPIWLQRLSLFILVVFCIYLGIIVAVLPWWTAVWDRNLLLTAHPLLWAVLRTPAARGVISGCGLLDIWVGISEAIHYRDRRN